MFGRGEEARKAALAQFLAQGANPVSLVAVARVRIGPFRRPGLVFIEDEHQAGDALVFCVPVLAFGDGEPVRVVFIGHVAVAPGKDADIEVAALDVFQARVQWPVVAGDIMLHGQDLELHLLQRIEHRLAVVLEVGVSGREIDLGHVLVFCCGRGHKFSGIER